MSYAVRNDLQGWRAISGHGDVGVDEWYSLELPPDPVPLPMTPDEIIASINRQRDELLALSAIRIAPLQDAVDLDKATPEDLTNLKLWKQYRVAVNRIDQQPGHPLDFVWPTPPSSL